jgi:hypothetical protein
LDSGSMGTRYEFCLFDGSMKENVRAVDESTA